MVNWDRARRRRRLTYSSAGFVSKICKLEREEAGSLVSFYFQPQYARYAQGWQSDTETSIRG